MRRILYVNSPSYVAGAEISLLTLMQNLDAKYYQAVLLTSEKGPLTQEAALRGITWFAQPFPWFSRRCPWQYGLSIYRLYRTIRANDIDLVHTNCDHSLRYVMHACGLARVPYISHVRDFVRTWFRPEKVAALNRAARVIANSHAVAQACIQAGIAEERVTTIYNPIDVEAFQAASPIAALRLRSELNIPATALVVGIVGQIHPVKGHKEFIESGLQLVARVPGIHFLIVGAAHGESNELFLAALKGRVLGSTYADRFHFVGFRTDIPVMMKAIDILAVPSWTESFGRVAVEGMASGCAVVATNAGGLPEIITDGVDGLLIAPRDVEALTAALYQLCVDPELRQQLSKRGQVTAQRFTVARHIQEVQFLYDEVLS